MIREICYANRIEVMRAKDAVRRNFVYFFFLYYITYILYYFKINCVKSLNYLGAFINKQFKKIFEI